MQMDLKSNHHYVYKHYLNGWAVNGAKTGVFYLTKKRSIARDSAAGLCVERDFYNFPLITGEDLFLFEKLISTFGEQHHESSRKRIAEYYKLSNMHRFLSQFNQTHEVRKILQLIEKNTLEDLHCQVENSARPILKDLWRGDFNVLASVENCAVFAYFLGCQALRNKGPKVDSLNKFAELQSNDTVVRERSNLFWAKYWNIIVSLLSENMGLNIFGSLRRGQFEFLVNETDLPFITSDRPVNNIHPDEIGKKNVPTAMDLYYPLSPRLAFHFPELFSGCREVRQATKNEVDKLNIKVAKSSFGTIVSSTKESIERYREFVPLQT